MSNFTSSTDMLRAEIAASAARRIAEDGTDYATAKRKAVKQVLGNTKVRGNIMPDNAQIEEEVRRYNELFLGDIQPARLLHLRKLALRMMEELACFTPHLTGAVLNGTAGEHSDIHLQLFSENAKEVEFFLINRNISFDVSETTPFNGRSEPVETLGFLWQNEGIHLTLYATDDLRGAVKGTSEGKMARAGIEAVRALIAKTEAQ